MKTLKMKLIYVIAAVAMLAMLIPAMAIPVSAQPFTLVMTTVAGAPDGGYDVTGDHVVITLMDGDVAAADGTVTNWQLDNIVPETATWLGGVNPNTLDPIPSAVTVVGIWGEAEITATFGDPPEDLTVDKKWGQILRTDFSTANGSTPVTWNESEKAWFGTGSVTDNVIGDFIDKDDVRSEWPLQDVKLNWYLVDSNVVVPMHGTGTHPDEAPALKAAMAALPPAAFVQFVDPTAQGFDPYDITSPGWLGTEIQTVSGSNGASTINIGAWGEEGVKIIVVPEYPYNPQLDVVREVTTWNFWTREMEVVPQVRWAGEKIVLEKNFGTGLTGALVNFVLTAGEGALEQFGPTPSEIGLNLTSNSVSVWTEVNELGVAACILTSDVPNEVDVRAALYAEDGETMINQHAYVTYFMKFESLTLGDVVGKRAGHNTGVWTEPSNPFNPDFPAADTEDVPEQDRNVSQDALERAQVRGWFMAANASTRLAEEQDLDGDGEADIMLPAGRWILPDDWAKLAGVYNWQERRIHWDIMDQADDDITALTPTGAYLTGQYTPVQGPFSPGIELMTPTGWELGATSPDPDRDMKTVVPDGKLNAWDAPMPPAKIIFEILEGVVPFNQNGFFKEAMKSDIYILAGEYTNPFYQALIPAHWAIPAFINNGGYDWDSFLVITGSDPEELAYGPYVFWTVINQPSQNAAVPSTDWAGHPTKVEVYSDNHGEAMVFVNGDWNLDLTTWTGKGGADVPLDAEVGTTTIQAMADYPYVRSHQPIASNTVLKHWFWGGQILGTDGHTFATGDPTESTYTRMVLTAGNYTVVDTGASYPDELGTSNDKVVWVWATDRDGMQAGVLGTKVQWRVTGGAYIPAINANQISNYNPVTQNIPITNGFISAAPNTPTGVITNPDRTMGYSFLRNPTVWERQLFNKKWPALYTDPTGQAPINFAVAALDILSESALTDVTVETILTGPDFGFVNPANGQVQVLGNVFYSTNVDFTMAYPMDDPIKAGDANADGVVDVVDITAVERIIMGLDAPNVNADTNQNGFIDMGDVVMISRIIHGLE